MWRTDLLIEAAEAAVRRREATLRAEQAVYGLDALEETELHPLLAKGFRKSGLGVLSEQPYPMEWTAKRGRRRGMAARDEQALPDRRDRLRCDLVLTERPGQKLVDPLALERSGAAIRKASAGTLFEAAGEAEAALVARQTDGAGTPPEEAYWLEVKLSGQFCYSTGVPGPNRTYGSELRRAVQDLLKLEEDPRIVHGGLLLVVFTLDEATARHDLLEIAHTCLDRGIPIASPTIRHVEIRERIGNHLCSLCLFDLRKPPAGGA